MIVEGYTDVMACHLAGVPTAVATCGTAFGADHIGVLRRLLHGHRQLGRRDHLHLRRGRGRAEGGAAGVRGRPAVRRADVHRGQPGQHGPVRAAAGQGRPGGARPGRPARAAGRLRAAARRSAASTWTPSRAGSRRMRRRRAAGRARSRTGRSARSTPASSPATSAWRSSRCSGRCWPRPARRRPAAAPARAGPAGASRSDSPQSHGRAGGAEAGAAGAGAGRADVRRGRGRRLRHPVHVAVRHGDRRGRRGARRRPAGRSGSRRSATPATTWPARRWSASWRWSRCGSTASPTRGTSSITLARLQLGSVTARIRDLKSKMQRINPVDAQGRVLRACSASCSRWSSTRGRCASRPQEGCDMGLFGRNAEAAGRPTGRRSAADERVLAWAGAATARATVRGGHQPRAVAARPAATGWAGTRSTRRPGPAAS